MSFSQQFVRRLPLVAFLLAAAPAAETAPEWPGLALPTPAELRAQPIPPHPRLILSRERIDEMRRQVSAGGRMQSWYAELETRGDRYGEEALPTYIVERTERYSRTLLSMSRRMLERTQTFALLYRLSGDKKYAERAWRELEAAAGFRDWNPVHFLDVGEMTHAFAIGYDWLYDYWTPERRARLKSAIIEKGLRPAEAGYRENAGWTRRHNNWNQVTNGGIGIGCLALLDVEPDLASSLLHEALRRLPRAFQQYAPDGGWQEGIYYWHVATRYSVYIAAALESCFGTDFGLSAAPGFSETGWFPIHLTSPGGPAYNFGDSYAIEYRAAHLFWLARRFEQPAFARFQRHAADTATNPLVRFDPGPFYSRELTGARTAMDLVWYLPQFDRLSEADPLPADKVFTSVRVGTMRSRWDDPHAAFVGYKGGDNRDSHNHLDLGSFVFDVLGVRWAIEVGRIDYYPPDAFHGGLRWGYYNMRAEGHNTLVIDPAEKADQDPAGAAPILRHSSTPGEGFAIVDLTATAYPGKVRRQHRGIALTDGRTRLLVQDEVEAGGPVDAWWFMHTRAAIELSADGSAAVLSQDGRQVVAQIHTPAGARFEILEAKPLHPSPAVTHQMEPDGVRRLAVRCARVTDLRLAITLTPIDGGAGPARRSIAPLEEWAAP